MGQGERLWARVSEAGSTNGSMVAQLLGQVDADRMHRAVQLVARIHPMLRAYIAPPPHRDVIVAPDIAKVPWRVEARTNDQHWESVVEQELNQPIHAQERPLWRVCLLQGPQASELILTMHHAVTDGSSGYLLMTHILQAYDGRKALLEAQPLPEAHDDLLIKPKDWQQWVFNARSLLRMSFRPKPAAWKAPAGVAPRLEECETRIISAQLDAATYETLQRLSQAQGQTINGLIAAVYMQSAAEIMQVRPDQLMSMSSAVSIRHLLPRSFARTVAYLVSSCEIESRFDHHDPPWVLAGEITAQTMRQMRARHVVLNLWLRWLILKLKPEGHQLIAAAPRTSRANVHLTNMGRVKIPRDPGGLHLLRCFHVSSVHLAQRPFVNLASVTIDGELQMSFSYCAPQTPRAQVEQLIDAMITRFRSLARADAVSSLQPTPDASPQRAGATTA